MCLLRRRGLKGGVVRIRRGLKRDDSKGVLPSCHVCHYSTAFVPSHIPPHGETVFFWSIIHWWMGGGAGFWPC